MKFGLAGYPIGHSGSPALFSSFCGGRWPYELIETPDFEEVWQRFLCEYQAINLTAPFKEKAFEKAVELADSSGHPELVSGEVRAIGAANILVKTADGVAAYNSDYLAVKEIIAEVFASRPELRSIAVIGLGGAGKAAASAASDFVSENFGDIAKTAGPGAPGVLRLHHDQIAGGVDADLVIFTLPRRVEGCERIRCRVLLEANYRDPSMGDGPYEYLPGTLWLEKQARLGYPLMVEGAPLRLVAGSRSYGSGAGGSA